VHAHADWLRDQTFTALGLDRTSKDPKFEGVKHLLREEKALRGVREVEGLNIEEYATIGDAQFGSKVSLLSGLGNGGSPTQDRRAAAKKGNDHGVVFGRKQTSKLVLDQRKRLRRLLGDNTSDKYATFEQYSPQKVI